MEDKKVRYLYHLSLSDGRIIINESDGLFSINSAENPDDKTLIHSAVLIRVVEPQVEEVQGEAPAGQTSIVDEVA